MTAVSWRPSSSAATGWRWRDAQALREWWKGVIGYTDVPGDADMPGHEECMIVDPATGHRVLFIEVPDPTPGKDKMHFALRPTLSLIHISEPTRRLRGSRMPSSA